MVTLFLSGRKMGDPHERPFGRSLTGPRKWPGPLLLRDHASKLRTKERKANMLTTETQQFARVLTDKLVEITNQRQGRDRIAIETSPDEVEEASSPQRETLP
jgi:hypothetical protein